MDFIGWNMQKSRAAGEQIFKTPLEFKLQLVRETG
jgi:hypothetical protein